MIELDKLEVMEVIIVEFWLLMAIIDLIIPLTMIGLGWYLLKSTRGSKEVFGFKSDMWMKNIDTEKFAYNFCSKYYFLVGLIMLTLSIIVMTLVISKAMSTIALIGMIISVLQGFLLASVPLVTEIALRRTFDKDGHRR